MQTLFGIAQKDAERVVVSLVELGASRQWRIWGQCVDPVYAGLFYG